jgi:hypothetical protein
MTASDACIVLIAAIFVSIASLDARVVLHITAADAFVGIVGDGYCAVARGTLRFSGRLIGISRGFIKRPAFGAIGTAGLGTAIRTRVYSLGLYKAA